MRAGFTKRTEVKFPEILFEVILSGLYQSLPLSNCLGLRPAYDDFKVHVHGQWSVADARDGRVRYFILCAFIFCPPHSHHRTARERKAIFGGRLLPDRRKGFARNTWAWAADRQWTVFHVIFFVHATSFPPKFQNTTHPQKPTILSPTMAAAAAS